MTPFHARIVLLALAVFAAGGALADPRYGPPPAREREAPRGSPGGYERGPGGYRGDRGERGPPEREYLPPGFERHAYPPGPPPRGYAGPQGGEPPGFPPPVRGRMEPLGGVITTIGRRTPGRQLDTEMEFMDGRPVYRVIWLTIGGRRMDYVVDAESGAILSAR